LDDWPACRTSARWWRVLRERIGPQTAFMHKFLRLQKRNIRKQETQRNARSNILDAQK
jgi:hypothetical protein